MSDEPRGPNWWLASDGKWYPPTPPLSATPSPAGPGMPPPAGPGVSPPAVPGSGRGTNGLAVAALVLGILWICGVGSLLALILGIIGVRQIARTGQSGKGMAIAGIVLGSLGLLVTAGGAVLAFTLGQDVLETTADERDDVDIRRCGIAEGDNAVTAELLITNDSSQASSYLIMIEFSDGSAGSTAAAEMQTVDRIEPGESSKLVVKAPSSADLDEPATCRIALVQRFGA